MKLSKYITVRKTSTSKLSLILPGLAFTDNHSGIGPSIR